MSGPRSSGVDPGRARHPRHGGGPRVARGARVGCVVSAGYVVRGTWKPREPDPGKPRDVYAWWWELIQDVQWISDREKVPAELKG